MEHIQNILEVKVADEIFGFDANEIEQILRIPPITNIPLSDGCVVGVAVLSGKIFHVIDLGVALGSSEVDLTKDSSRLLTFCNDGCSEAFVVDEVLGIIDVKNENLEEIESDDSFIRGFYKTENYVVQLVNIEKVVKSITLEPFKPKNLDALKDENKNKDSDKKIVNEEFKRVLFFKAENEKFAIDIESLRELIFVPKEITPIAGSDALGMITLRDEVITILDMNSILGFSFKEPDEKSRALIAWHNGMSVALLVDEVEEVKTLETKNIEPMPQDVAGDIIEYIYKDKDDVVSIISSNYIRALIRKYHIENEDIQDNNNISKSEADVSEVAVFKIADEEYAFDIEDVQEIIRYETITPVPEAPLYVEGILNLRGSVIAIISLPQRLGFECSITEKTKIIVCSIENEKIGFIVDDVNEILFVEDENIAKSASEESLFDEVINLDNGDRVILKIKVENLLDDETLEHIKMMNK